MAYFMLALMILLGIALILIVLVQRGKGGGLAGAFGGMGGQSALGAKAGDTFTRITIVVAVVWIFSCIGTIWALNAARPSADGDEGLITVGADAEDGGASNDAAPATDGEKAPE